MTLAKLLIFFKPQILHFRKGDNNRTYFIIIYYDSSQNSIFLLPCSAWNNSLRNTFFGLPSLPYLPSAVSHQVLLILLQKHLLAFVHSLSFLHRITVTNNIIIIGNYFYLLTGLPASRLPPTFHGFMFIEGRSPHVTQR